MFLVGNNIEENDYQQSHNNMKRCYNFYRQIIVNIYQKINFLFILQNAGYVQGCVHKRDQIPNPYREGRYWHWSDFNIGEEISFYGTTYKLCSCDQFTREYLTSMGVVVGENEPAIEDPYLTMRQMNLQRETEKSKMPILASDGSFSEEKFRKFLEYDGVVLRYV